MNICLTDEMVEVLDKLITNNIPERKAYVLRTRLGMLGPVKTYRELGNEYGVSKHCVRMYYIWSINKLRRMIYKNEVLRQIFYVKGEL